MNGAFQPCEVDLDPSCDSFCESCYKTLQEENEIIPCCLNAMPDEVVCLCQDCADKLSATNGGWAQR